MLTASQRPISPRFGAWPETPSERVTVLCEGISAHTNQEELRAVVRARHAPVVAVNRALSFSSEVPIDFWATTDDPKNLWEWSNDIRPPHLRIFTSENQMHIWSRMVEAGKLESLSEIYAWHATPMTGVTEPDGSTPYIPTLFPVLAWLLRVGAKDVVVCGADMRGSGTPGIDYSPYADLGHAIRWQVERWMFALSVKQYRKKGARLTRWIHSWKK